MSNYFTERTISYPFKLTSNGNVQTTTSQSVIWADRIRAVVGTLYGERVMLQEFGTKTPGHVLDGGNAIMADVRREISEAIFNWLPKITVKEIIVGQVELDGTVSVDIRYQLPNNTESSVSVGVVALSGNRVPVEAKL